MCYHILYPHNKPALYKLIIYEQCLLCPAMSVSSCAARQLLASLPRPTAAPDVILSLYLPRPPEHPVVVRSGRGRRHGSRILLRGCFRLEF